MSIVVAIVSGFSAWLVLGPDEYLIDVQSKEAVALIQFKLCFNLKLVTAITRGQKYAHAENQTGVILTGGQRRIH